MPSVRRQRCGQQQRVLRGTETTVALRCSRTSLCSWHEPTWDPRISGTVCGCQYAFKVTMTAADTTTALNYGEVFTRRWVVEVLLDLTGYTVDKDLGGLVIVEPSVGSGAFLGPIVERLVESARVHGRDLESLRDAVRGFELQPAKAEESRELVAHVLREGGASTELSLHLASTWVRDGDFLLDDLDVEAVDVVVGNPPYIRYDDLDDDTAAAYRRRWPTMQGRGDIYVGFFERGLRLLKKAGRLGYICADRWMRNRYGAELRQFVSSAYAVEHVWSMHDVDAFEARVSAYPAITVIANSEQRDAVVAEMTETFDEASARLLQEAMADHDAFDGPGVRAHRLPSWFPGDDLWPTGSPARLALIELLNERFHPLHDPSTGTRVSIGIATGADKVYVTKDADAAEPDRMLPLSMRRDLMSGHFEWLGNYLVNPWDEEGKLVSLDAYPKMAAYLANHPELRNRHVAKKAPNGWYRTIDKVQPELVDKPKLLLQDMKARIHPVLEPGGFYPHHNLYHVTSSGWDLEVLGGLLLSRVAQAFIEAYCVRMRGGTLRFQAQYLKRIRVPRPESLSEELRAKLVHAFRTRDVDAATRAAALAYGIDTGEYELDSE